MKLSLKFFLNILQFVFAIALAYFAIRIAIYHFHLITFPYPNTFREGAMMSMTDAFVKGQNPYNMAMQPQYMNLYGIIYPLLSFPFAKLFGTTILIHRIVAGFFLLASCGIVFFVIRKMNVPLLLNICSVVMLYASLTYPATSTPCIDPGSTGLFLLLATIFIPWFYKYSYPSLLISITCGILALYTKQYAVLGIPIIASYLFLFVSKQKALLYSLIGLVLLILSLILVNQIFPLYCANSFFALMGFGSAWLTIERLQMQLVLYSQLHQWTFLLIGIYTTIYLFKTLRNNFIQNIKTNATALLGSFNFKNLNEPLIKINFNLSLFAGLWTLLVLLACLGQNNGATLWYFFQLLSPFLLICSAWLFSRQKIWPLLCVPLLIYNLHIMTADHNYKWFNPKIMGWPQMTELVNQHHSILNSSLITPLLIQQNKPFFDNGHTEYFLYAGQRSNPIIKKFFPEDMRIYIEQMLVFENIKEKVRNKEYDLIALGPNLLPGVGDDIKKYYHCMGNFLVYAPQDRRPYPIAIWFPN